MTDITVSIADQFTEFPTGRYKIRGAGSGEEFREKFLLRELTEGNSVTVLMDGTAGYPSSFLEEAFGGLIRKGLSLDLLKKNLTLIAHEPEFQTYQMLAWSFIEDAAKRVSEGAV